jgi:hypothetical protein
MTGNQDYSFSGELGHPLDGPKCIIQARDFSQETLPERAKPGFWMFRNQ